MLRPLVLLVEDNRENQAAVEALLRADGFAVTVADNGQEALDVLRAGVAPCLVLLDLMMPVKDGHAFREEQLADPRLAHIPVVVFSGAYDVPTMAARLGVHDYLTKPIDIPHMLDTVRRYCGDAPQP